MHPLLERQIRRHLRSDAAKNPELAALLAAVETAYIDFDAERQLLQRAIELSSRELLQANAGMHALFQALPDLFFRLTPDGRILDCRGGHGQDLLVPVDRLIGRRIDSVPDTDVADEFRKALQRLRDGALEVVIDYALATNGESRHFEARLSRIANGDIVAIIREIAERVRSSVELRRHDAFLRQILDLNPNFIFAKDAEGRFSLVNQAVADAYGSTVNDLLGKTDADFNSNEDEVRHFRNVDLEVIRSGQDHFVPEERITDAQGRTLWLQTIKRAIASPDGQTRQVLGVATDITLRRQAEERLEIRTRQILEHQTALHDMAILDNFDLASSLRSITEIAASTLRVATASVWLFSDDRRRMDCRMHFQAGRPWRDTEASEATSVIPNYLDVIRSGRTIAAGSAAVDRRVAELRGTTLGPEGVTSLLHTAIRQQGTLLGILAFDHTGPERDWTPEEQNFAGSAADLVALALAAFSRQQLEQQLLQSQKMEAVGTLAGGVAHDFNNILTAILGYCDRLRARLPADSEPRAHAEEIWKASDRAAALTRQLLAFSRKQHVAPRRLHLGRVLDGMEPMLRRLIGENIRFETRVDPAAGWVTMDPSQIEQILLNLVVNAREAMPDGGRLTVAVGPGDTQSLPGDTEWDTGGRGAVELTVTDTGHGIDEATQSRIFEPFFTTKGPGKGTGLGLAMVYAIVQQSGGSVTVDSTPGAGARFAITLPESMEQEATPVAPLSAAEVVGGTETILLAEDEGALRALTSHVLTERGYRVLAAPDGETALDLAGAEPRTIDLLITDMVMPGISGARLGELIEQRYPGIPILYLSGYTADNIVPVDGKRPGRSFLQKPFQIDELSRTVRMLLDGVSVTKIGSGALDEAGGSSVPPNPARRRA